MTTQRPTAELIAELRNADPVEMPYAAEQTIEDAADHLESILKAWEEYVSFNGDEDTHMQALRLAITGASAEVRG